MTAAFRGRTTGAVCATDSGHSANASADLSSDHPRTASAWSRWLEIEDRISTGRRQLRKASPETRQDPDGSRGTSRYTPQALLPGDVHSDSRTARISREATRDRLRYEFGGPLLYKWLIYYAGFRFDEFF